MVEQEDTIEVAVEADLGTENPHLYLLLRFASFLCRVCGYYGNGPKTRKREETNTQEKEVQI